MKRASFLALAVLLSGAPHLQGRRSPAYLVGVAAQTPATGSINCSLSGYKAASGLTAAVAGDALTVTWDGDRTQQLRLRFTIPGGTPTIQELAVRRKGSDWATLAANVTPEFRVASGRRRMDGEGTTGLVDAGIVSRDTRVPPPDVFEKYQWDSFWDAPLFVPGGPAESMQTRGLPRKAEEVVRATATYQAQSCEVKTDGSRLIVTFPGVTLGVFAGQLQFTVFKGSNLIEQEVVAKTEQNSVAYKYDAGLKGLAIGAGSRMTWRDLTNLPQSYAFGGARSERDVAVTTANRLLIAERGPAGSIAAFPPPHNFFWVRESNKNLGYNWYRKDSDASFSFGIRQSDDEDEQRYKANFALYNARPGAMQHMPVFFYVSADPAEQTREAVLAFTHGDRYKPLAGYKVMIHHTHMGLGYRLRNAGSPDAEMPDLVAFKALGINIVSPVDTIGMTGDMVDGQLPKERTPADVLKMRNFEIEGARHHSDKDFLVLPSHEFEPAPIVPHTDLLYSHPTYWLYGRTAGQPFVEDVAPYGKVYHIGGPEDLIEMAKREDAILSMPHPRTKNNMGWPDALFQKPQALAAFKDPRFQSLGFRWGMGIDRSERRLCEIRCLSLLDEASNWFADDPTPPKYILAISEVHHQDPGDDVYAFSPVSYVKLASVPTPDDASSVIHALMAGDSFVSSGEVLMPAFSVQGTGNARKVVADVEWTFPLDFVEVVWGDGKRTDRQIVSTTETAGFGQRHFEIPFDPAGKKWVRFAAWDAAGNGALSQPVKLARP